MIKRIGLALVAAILTIPLAGTPAQASSPSGLRVKQLTTHCVRDHAGLHSSVHCRQRQIDREQGFAGSDQVLVYFQHRDWNPWTHDYDAWTRWRLNHVLVPCTTEPDGLCRQPAPGR